MHRVVALSDLKSQALTTDLDHERMCNWIKFLFSKENYKLLRFSQYMGFIKNLEIAKHQCYENWLAAKDKVTHLILGGESAEKFKC